MIALTVTSHKHHILNYLLNLKLEQWNDVESGLIDTHTAHERFLGKNTFNKKLSQPISRQITDKSLNGKFFRFRCLICAAKGTRLCGSLLSNQSKIPEFLSCLCCVTRSIRDYLARKYEMPYRQMQHHNI